MVEIMIRKLLLTIFSVAAFAAASAQDVRPRIAGLESNDKYMSLLRDDLRLQEREDSLINRMGALREQFRRSDGAGTVDPNLILTLENQVFDVRNRRGHIAAQVNAIEQDWVLNNIGAEVGAETFAASEVHENAVPESSKVRNLIYNLPFSRNLPQGDYAELKRAQGRERLAERIAGEYKVLYDSLVETAAAYSAAATEDEGERLFAKYGVTERMAAALADSLAGVWSGVFDSKSYAYGYLLERLEREDVLEAGERYFSTRRGDAAAEYGRYASDALTDYSLQRTAMVEYETAIAEALELGAAADSLRRVLRDGAAFDYRLPAVAVEQRLFLDYAPVQFASPAIYSAKNPIPECRVFDRGTIYRVLLGTFWSKQAVSIFRGVYPLSFAPMNGKHLYFAGGFETRAAADEAAAELRKHGFKRPEVVVWRDGEYRNLATDPEPAERRAYRVEMSGVPTLSETVRGVIAEHAEGLELTRVGESEFVVGAFDERGAADALADAVRAADGGIEIKVEEIVVQ